ncbi:hypothetical protein GCM10009801_76740 [Streptomyces albiaxialis]|uniref:Uncharacterized protein n=1 Tax=Streptomyces albiaxialis TaxID=329523 RepID=A0ABN2X3P9_9ACTN
MGNAFGAGERRLYLSNGGTDVFVDVLVLAVSALAEEPWDLRFAALLTWQDQDLMGRGNVGFDLEEIDWGATGRERAGAKDFVLRATALALRRHRWDELGYDPPFAEGCLREFAAMVASFDPHRAPAPADEDRFPGPGEGAVASCVRHRLLSRLPYRDGCVLCAGPDGRD